METKPYYLYEDLSYEVIGCAFEAFKTVGVGFDEIRYHKVLSVGYHSKIYQNAIAVALKQNNIAFDSQVQIDTKIENIEFKPYEIDYWLIENVLLLGILAGKDKPRLYDLFRMRSYLKHLKLQYGVIAYRSTRNLQLYVHYRTLFADSIS